MDTQNIATILVTAITVLGSSAAWNFYERRLKMAAQAAENADKNNHMFRDDLRERVAVLEDKLERSYKERSELQNEILKMAESLAALRVEVEFLRKENENLKKQLQLQSKGTNS
jgi:chromosome segregation ATPase